MISQYSQPLQSLNQPGITPLPFEEMMKAGQYVQKRYDDSVNATEDQYTQLANSNIIDAQKVALDNVKGTFSKEMSNLMDKYKGQTYSSDFQRESKRLISQMSSDPTVKMLKENKAQYEFDDATARQMKANGIEYYDPRLNNQAFMNEDGTAKQYKAGVRALKHDDLIDKQGNEILNAMVQNGSETTNYKQLDRAIVAGTSDNSPIFKDKKAALMQQGYTEKDANKAAKAYITQRFNTFRKKDIDAQMLKMEQEQYAAWLKKQQGPESVITPRGVGDIPAEIGDKAKIQTIDQVLREDELVKKNEQARANGKTVATGYTSSYGGTVGGYIGGQDNYTPQNTEIGQKKAQLNKEADKYFGNYARKYKTPEEKLKAYSRALSAHSAETSETLFAPENNDYNDAFRDYALGTNWKGTDLEGRRGFFQSDQADRTKEGISKSRFLGVATTKADATNPTGVAFRFAGPDGKEFSVYQDPKDIAPQLAFVGKLGTLKTQSAYVADPNTNMLDTSTWIKDYDLTTGEPVTYIPIRTFNNGEPATKLIKVKGDPDLLDGWKKVSEIYAMPESERNKRLESVDDLKKYAINDYFSEGTNMVPGVKSIDLGK